MSRLEKMARRAMQWAERARREGDAEGVEFAMQRYRSAQRRITAAMDAAFSPSEMFAYVRAEAK